jgi:ferredoxin
MKYRVIYDKKGCEGEFACAFAAPRFWTYDAAHKAELIGAKRNEAGEYELIIEEEDLPEMQAAAESCPVRAIRIEEAASPKYFPFFGFGDAWG